MKNRLYNLIFPIWMLIFIPMTWLIVLPANFLIDSLILLLSLFLFVKSNYWMIYKQTILKIWGFGFLSDFIGALILFSIYLSDFFIQNSVISNWWYYNVFYPVSYDTLSSIVSIIWCSIAVLVSGICIYEFNYRVSFKQLSLEPKTKKKMALLLAICTAPYLFLVPTALFF